MESLAWRKLISSSVLGGFQGPGEISWVDNWGEITGGSSPGEITGENHLDPFNSTSNDTVGYYLNSLTIIIVLGLLIEFRIQRAKNLFSTFRRGIVTVIRDYK